MKRNRLFFSRLLTGIFSPFSMFNFKHLVGIVLVLLVINPCTFAQAPQKMSYQAIIRDGSNVLVRNQAIGMRVSILQGSSEGERVFKEVYNPNPETNENGLVSIEIGTGDPVEGSFSEIDWSAGPYFIKTETDPTGGTLYTITGISQLLSVPYALHAHSADFVSNITISVTGDTLNLGGKILIIPGISLANKLPDTTVTDSEGNVYPIINIGNQVWMAENLRTTIYNDSNPIINVMGNGDWSNINIGAYSWFENNSTNGNTYGALYNFNAVKTGKLCPVGWSVPSNEDWAELSNFLGGNNISGGKLKATGTIEDSSGLWNSPNTDATNETGFTGLPGGIRDSDGSWIYKGVWGVWWSSTSFSPQDSHATRLLSDSPLFDSGFSSKIRGYSVRCIKD